MTAPAVRVRQLIAKALDAATSEDEARSCALIAVRLIEEHKLLMPLSAPQRPPPPRRDTSYYSPPDFEELLRRRRRAPRPEPAPARPPWWDLLPCELRLFGDRTCAVCSRTCSEGSRAWAIALEPPREGEGDLLPRVRVCHLECRDQLPVEQRRSRRTT